MVVNGGSFSGKSGLGRISLWDERPEKSKFILFLETSHWGFEVLSKKGHTIFC